MGLPLLLVHNIGLYVLWNVKLGSKEELGGKGCEVRFWESKGVKWKPTN